MSTNQSTPKRRTRNTSSILANFKKGMANVQFSTEITPSDPQEQSVLLVGQKCYLDFLDYESVKPLIGTRVTEELYEKALNLVKGNVESVPLYLKYATLARLPNVCSRHNTPSQAHTLAKLVKAHMGGRDGFVVVACDYRDILASACAIARCFPLYSRKQRDSSFTVTVHFIVMSPCKEKRGIMGDDVDCLVAAAMGVRLSARIVDMPCSEMNTDAFIQEICKVGDMLNIKPVIIKGEELVSKGFGGIYSVGKAAEHQPALVVLSHVMPEAIETIAWVGKGIVFDTGGLFIKARNSMPGMKRDCGGAAAILGAFYCAVTMGFKENLHAVFCLAENAVGPKATRPDDVIKMYSGKTVEITNTDAEGRLVLGDGVAYAKRNLRATTILDMATLTGAQGTANGRYHAALLTNSETWERRTVNAGRLSGDLVHPVVYTPEIHLSEFNSTVADMKNSVTDTSNTPVACAGLFIGSHIDFEPDWIHIDMSKPSHFADRATGYGVALLPTLFGSFSNNRLLQYLGLIVNET